MSCDESRYSTLGGVSTTSMPARLKFSVHSPGTLNQQLPQATNTMLGMFDPGSKLMNFSLCN